MPLKSTARQIADGDPRKIGINKLQEKLAAEPKATTGLPECPSHLRGRARTQFEIWKSELEVMNLNRLPDSAMLEGACLNYAQAIIADTMIRKEGIVIRIPIFSKDGSMVGENVKAHPAVDVSRKAWGIVKSFCSEFGFSPVSRTRLAVQPKDDGSKDLAAMLSRPREAKGPQAQDRPRVN